MYKDKFSMTQEENVFYAKRNIVDSIYKAAKVEGIAVTFPQTQEIVEGRSVSGLSVDDVIKINNLKHAWQFIFDTIDYPVDLRYIRQINQEVGERIVFQSGILRQNDVSIGGTAWKPDIPDESVVEANVTKIMESNETFTEKAMDMMLYLMRAQLFQDGNKRTAQIVANQMMIQNGVGIINIPTEKNDEFFTLLVDFYETNKAEKIKDFLYNNCLDGISVTVKRVEEKTTRDMFLNKNDRKRGKTR